MSANIIDGLSLQNIQGIFANVLVIIKEHDSFIPELFPSLMGVKARNALGSLARINTAHIAVVFVEKVVDTALGDIRQRLRLGEIFPWNDDGDQGLSLNATNTNAVRLRIDKLNP